MKPADARQLEQELQGLADPEQARRLSRFFKTGPGQYAEHDCFLGIRVPVLRRLARDYRHLPLSDLSRLIASPYHEQRFISLLLLQAHFQHGAQQAAYAFYQRHLAWINNWDLVDVSAPGIVGAYLYARPRDALYQWAAADSLWTRRVAVVANFYFIRQGDFRDTLRLCYALLHDDEDLIHKACGWMLREVGKRDVAALHAFLHQHAATMPRVMLRYAIEKLPPEQRRDYLSKT